MKSVTGLGLAVDPNNDTSQQQRVIPSNPSYSKMSSPHPDEHKMLTAMRAPCPYWMNPDGTPKAFCAAPAGTDGDDGERAAAPVRPVLNPEDEDESDVESGLGADEVPPHPETTWVQGGWLEWEEVPEPEGLSYFSTVKRWRFKHTLKGGYQQRSVIQVELRGETHTHIVCAEQVKMVTNKIREGAAVHEVVIDTTKQKGHWNPTYLKFRFQNAENALAFQLSLVDFLSS